MQNSTKTSNKRKTRTREANSINEATWGVDSSLACPRVSVIRSKQLFGEWQKIFEEIQDKLKFVIYIPVITTPLGKTSQTERPYKKNIYYAMNRDLALGIKERLKDTVISIRYVDNIRDKFYFILRKFCITSNSLSKH